jgi:hypothetical protein
MEDATAAKRQKRSAGPADGSVDLTQSDDDTGVVEEIEDDTGVVEELEDDPDPISNAKETLREPSPPSPPRCSLWRPGVPKQWAHLPNMSHVRIPEWYVRHKFGPVELAKETPIQEDLYEKMARRYKPTDVVGVVPSIPITMIVLKRVEEDWLNDELVNFIFEWWRNLINSGGGPNKFSHSSRARPRCWFANTFFYRKLSMVGETKGYFYEEVARWTNNIDLFGNYDVMLIPINEGNNHWYLAVVDFVHERTEIYDSMLGGRTRSEVHTTLRRYLRDEHLAKRGSELMTREWTTHTNELWTVPQQDNGFDCGVFMWLFAAYRSMECEFKFTQGDIRLIRRFITTIIYKSGLKELDLQPV